MDKIDFNNKKIIFNKMIEYGLDTNKKILEISNKSHSEICSFVELLDNKSNGYLICKNFDKKMANKSGIKGTEGEFHAFLHDVYATNQNGTRIDLSNYDIILGYGNVHDLIMLPYLNKDIYAGYITNKDSKYIQEQRNLYSSLYSILRIKYYNTYNMIVEDYNNGKDELRLIYKK